MAVSDDTNKTRQNGNDVTVTFNFTFKIFNESDLEVFIIDTTTDPESSSKKTITTDYTVNINKTTEGGSVTFVSGTPTSDEDIFIKRVLPFTQGLELEPNITFPEEAVENAFDKSRMLDIQLNEEANRTLKLNQFSEYAGELDIPNPVASRVIGFDSTGLAITLFSGSDLDTILTSTFGQQLVQSADAETARNFLELGVLDDVEFNDLIVNDLELEDLQINKILNFQSATQKISSGTIPYIQKATILESETGSTDDWDGFTGGNPGDVCRVTVKAGHIIIVKQSSTLELAYNLDVIIPDGNDSIDFECKSAGNWKEVGRSIRKDFTSGSLHEYLPNNKLKQYGVYTAAAHAPTITFPIAFDSINVALGICTSAGINLATTAITTANFVGDQTDSSGTPSTAAFHWVAIGTKAQT